MELNQLRYFLSVAELGSFSKAAACCFVSQPALSTQIQKLENELGKKLLDRTRPKVVPTEAGRILLGRAKRILAQMEIAKREIQVANEVKVGNLTFGVLPTIAPHFLPQVIVAFREKCPNIGLAILEDTTARLLQMISDHQLDFAVASPPIKEDGFEVEELFTEELLLALPERNPLCSKEKIRMDDLQSEHFILLHEGNCVSDQILNFCNRHGFTPRIALRSGQISTVQSLIRAGMGISLIPQMAAIDESPGIIYRSLDKSKPTRVIAVVKAQKHHSRKAVEDFLSHLRQWKKIGSATPNA